ncbi:lipopolysaccharide biosynthesis protein RfbH [Mycobacteroides abscessus subsp. abscessus]|nr:lipopolysaccharide biosynthesis protein RfbH [Mycobacteroides abscessus subsp. abscessus]
MVTSSDPEIIRGVKLARNQGMETRYANEIVGLNNRMTDIHAAIGRVQLTKVGAWTRARQDNAAFLDAHLRGVTVGPRRLCRRPA